VDDSMSATGRKSDAPPPAAPAGVIDTLRAIVRDVDALDRAVFAAIVATPTPDLDEPMRRLGRAADHSKLWLGVAAGLATLGGRRGRRAAAFGLASIGAASATVNLAVKYRAVRARPERLVIDDARQVPMPETSSFPSGHSAAAFAFAVAAGNELPVLALPLNAAACLVAYSRVHTGVHYPSDVLAGGAIGGAAGTIVRRGILRAVDHRARRATTG
jgi:undecaprenyl-diphosphatase